KAGPAPPDDAIEKARREQLERLKEALWQYAKGHEGRFPSSQSDTAILKELWQLPGTYGMQYVYLGGTATALDGLPLACEPEVYGLNRWVLFTDGTIRLLSSEEIRRALAGGKR